MEPTAIIRKKRLLLAGLSFFGDPFGASAEWTEENEIGRLWSRFMAYMAAQRDGRPFAANPGTGYEVHLHHLETPRTGFFEIFVGAEVTALEAVPVELVIKALPAAQYAVFTLTGQAIASDWSRAIEAWMAANGYRSAYRYGFQLYDQRFKGMDRLDESVIDAYVPIIAREQ
jgi:predicted transcriptional regulator YdeE